MPDASTHTATEDRPSSEHVIETPPPSDVTARPVEFARLEPRAAVGTGSTSLDSLRDVPITISVKLGHTVMPIAEILKLGPGAVVELEEQITQPVELTVRGIPFAIGEVVVVEEHFAVRIKSLLPPKGGKDAT